MSSDGALALGDAIASQPTIASANALVLAIITRGSFVHRASEAGHSAFFAPSIPCPDVARCALSAARPREPSSAYLTAFGGDEFRPVGIAELLASARESNGSSE